jgi:hypothetical protein
MFLIVLVSLGLVFTGCPTDTKTDVELATDTVDPAFWFSEIYSSLIERAGEISSDNYSGETGDEMGQIANCQYVCNAVNKKWGTSYTPVSGTASQAANCEYLLKLIGKANNNTTAFGTSAQATKQAVDTNTVNQAVNTLWVPGDKFVAVAFGSNKAAYSTNGINWTETPPFGGSSGIADGNGKFVAGSVALHATSQGPAYTTYLVWSTNGIDWNATAISNMSWPMIIGQRVPWNSITYGNGKFIAIIKFFAVYSTDGINWTEITLPSNADWRSVAYGNGKFVAVAYNSNKAAYSTDGINWTETTLPSSANWVDIVYGGD